MSKGSKIVPIRIPEDELVAICEAIASRNAHSADEPDSLSSWVRKAIQMRLAHLERSKKKKNVLDSDQGLE